MRHTFIAVPLLLLSLVCRAQDASLLGGALEVRNTHDRTFAAGMGYAYHLGEHVSFSAEYLNEGHPPLHHRDGFGGQLWLRTTTPEVGPSLAIGAGPYYYLDTTTGNGSKIDYRNEHGLGTLVSISAKWHLEKRSYIEARLNRVHGRVEHDSTMLLVGMGYELQNLPPETKRDTVEAGDNLLMVLAGRAIVNSFESESATAKALELRHTVTQNLEWSAMVLNEGEIGLVQRKGIAAQGWLLRPFTERTVLEMGGGAYAMHDHLRRDDASEESRYHVVPIVSIGIRYRIDPAWRVQASFTRVITPYHRDSDVLMLGIGRML